MNGWRQMWEWCLQVAAPLEREGEKRGYVERVERSGEIMKRARMKHGGVTIGTRTGTKVKWRWREKGGERKGKEGGRPVKAT